MKTDVRFPSNGLMVAGHVYTPDTATPERRPAVVVGHPTTGVKEQAAGLYARRLAEHGFVTLAFDAAYQGESEGEPHGLEDPIQRADDFRNAVSYLTTRDDVDPARIGILGICGSGGYVVYSAQTDRRMKAVATVSAADVPAWLTGGDDKAFDQLLDAAAEARNVEAAGGEAPTISLLPEAADESTPEAIAEFVDYYKTPRAQHPRATNTIAVRSADKLAQFTAYRDVDKIAPRPLLMIAGTRAMTLPVSEDAVSRAGDNAELVQIEGASHVDLYDKEPYVTQAVEKLAEFFTKNLSKG
ncbi:alpha/beta hydrolase [Amycolatopsis viridis]|uniref:Dienelactone hydrolase domain-containing protein n=1 Tax=Amycolatopsis viridis TaxID=185678 RepID=A0ABX0SYV2_9PSEU|nr:alpha/beta hydrolase [Amycolatopsis viridis]NIH80755.1 hypothetical protein [Amycolatopsis viridis]